MAETKRYRTGPTSFINLSDEDYKAWKDAGNREYGEPDAEAKAEEQPAENKARRAPAEKKQG